MQFTVDIEPVEGVEVLYELPLWIIISAIVAGIILLGIIILILWKVRTQVINVMITPSFPKIFFSNSRLDDMLAVDASD